MNSFIDQTFDDLKQIEEVVNDLRIIYPSLEQVKLEISFEEFHMLKDFLKIELLESVEIQRSSGMAQLAFFQAHHAVPIRRDGSASSSEVKAFVIVKLPIDVGSVFVRKEVLGDKVRELFQKLELKIEGDAEFNRKFYMLTKEKDKAKSLFNNVFRSLLCSVKDANISIEVHNSIMMIISIGDAGFFDNLKEAIRVGLGISAINYGTTV